MRTVALLYSLILCTGLLALGEETTNSPRAFVNGAGPVGSSARASKPVHKIKE